MFPTPFLSRMQSQLGNDYPAFRAALQAPPPVSVRLHPGRKKDLFEKNERVAWHPGGRYLPERPVFTLDPSFQAGAYYVQEASSMFLYEALRQTAGLGQPLRVLDLCASPGGKSTLLLSAIASDGFVLANEVVPGRVGALRANLESWGCANVAISNHDAEAFSRLNGFFDVVVVDAPCSGEGLFRKDPAATGEWSEGNAAMCVLRQQRILADAEKLVRPGGFLIYSTCTFNPAENEKNMAPLLKNGVFRSWPLMTEPAWGVAEQEWGYQFYPHRARGEGFYLCCLQRMDGPHPPAIKTAPWKDWQKLTAQHLEAVHRFFAQPGDFAFFLKPTGEVTALPLANLEDFSRLAGVLSRRAFGLMAGELKNKDFVPSHALALSLAVQPGLPAVELDRQQALQFLKKDNIAMPDVKKGWTLVRHQGLNLGWIKVLDNRINNYLPAERRIRMAVNEQ